MSQKPIQNKFACFTTEGYRQSSEEKRRIVPLLELESECSDLPIEVLLPVSYRTMCLLPALGAALIDTAPNSVSKPVTKALSEGSGSYCVIP